MNKQQFKAWYGACRRLANNGFTGNVGDRDNVLFRVGNLLSEYNGIQRIGNLHNVRSGYFARWHELRSYVFGRQSEYCGRNYRRATLAAMRYARIYNPDSMRLLP